MCTNRIMVHHSRLEELTKRLARRSAWGYRRLGGIEPVHAFTDQGSFYFHRHNGPALL